MDGHGILRWHQSLFRRKGQSMKGEKKDPEPIEEPSPRGGEQELQCVALIFHGLG